MGTATPTSSTPTSSTRSHLDRAAAVVASMLRDVDTAELDAPTPCLDWDLRTPEVEVAEDAGDFERALGAAGRDPRWTAPS